MKKNILLLLMPLFFVIARDAQAQEESYEDSCCLNKANSYAKILSGVNFLQNTGCDTNKSTYRTGYIIAGSIGYLWRYGLRLEAEYAFRRNSLRKIHFFGEGISMRGHFETSSYMANILWDLPLSSWGCALWNIQPFIGAGIGCDFLEARSSNSRVVFRENWNRGSWQMMAGLAYPLFCNTEVSLEYKFHKGGSCHFNNHSLGVGLIYKFNFLSSWIRRGGTIF